jgi:hypothetical protein
VVMRDATNSKKIKKSSIKINSTMNVWNIWYIEMHGFNL